LLEPDTIDGAGLEGPSRQAWRPGPSVAELHMTRRQPEYVGGRGMTDRAAGVGVLSNDPKLVGVLMA
jgi:hypothetical protein